VVGFRCGKVENLGGRMRRMKKRGPNVLYDLNDLLFFLTIRPRFLFYQFLWAYVRMDPVNVPAKFEVRSFTPS